MSCYFWGRCCSTSAGTADTVITELGQVPAMEGKVSFSWLAEMSSHRVFPVQKIVVFSCFLRIMRGHVSLRSKKLSLHGFPHKLIGLHFEAAMSCSHLCHCHQVEDTCILEEFALKCSSPAFSDNDTQQYPFSSFPSGWEPVFILYLVTYPINYNFIYYLWNPWEAKNRLNDKLLFLDFSMLLTTKIMKRKYTGECHTSLVKLLIG